MVIEWFIHLNVFFAQNKHHSICNLKKTSNKINYLKLCCFILAIIFLSTEQKIQVPNKYLYVESWSYDFEFHILLIQFP
jgi:hypothetical protein